jgi:hypothetical protein
MTMNQAQYPVALSIEYPDRVLDRPSTVLRIFYLVPTLIVLSALSYIGVQGSHHLSLLGEAGLLALAPALMIVFRQKYPRWWFDWNVQMMAFTNRIYAYFALMSDKYPSTDDAQYVNLTVDYPDVARDLNRFMPLVKWLLALPHYVALLVLNVAAVFAVIVCWFAILFTGRYPRSFFNFVEGVMRWNNRVVGYSLILVTDQYPPFSLAA